MFVFQADAPSLGSPRASLPLCAILFRSSSKSGGGGCFCLCSRVTFFFAFSPGVVLYSSLSNSVQWTNPVSPRGKEKINSNENLGRTNDNRRLFVEETNERQWPDAIEFVPDLADKRGGNLRKRRGNALAVLLIFPDPLVVVASELRVMRR